MTHSIVIGGASGFWGDSFTAVPQLLASNRLNYLVFDYLAEVTMSILARARAKDPALGYATDFVSEVLREHLPEIARQGIKVIANAGGTNPIACAQAVQRLIDNAGLTLKVAAVIGDDLMDRADTFRASGTTEMFSDAAFPDQLMSCNAYCGAFPIATALGRGADIVVTGRVVDSAVVLGACIDEFGWSASEFDRLAGGSLAGHIVECGAQGSGGLFTDWEQVPDWSNIGYPIVEISADGSFVVTKPEGSGGLVCKGSVAEQLVYEIGDPARYLLPDVCCDFTAVKIDELGDNRVRVSQARGFRPPDTLKVSATWQDGFRLTWDLTIVGIDADRKARKTAEAVFQRCARMLAQRGWPPFKESRYELLGAEATYGAQARPGPYREVVLRLGAKHADPRALALLLREATSTGTSMSAGTSGIGGHRPKPMPQVRMFSFLVAKAGVRPRVVMNSESLSVPFATLPESAEAPQGIDRFPAAQFSGASVPVPLVQLAWARSGDKGNKANIGVIARRSEYLPYIAAALTPEAVKRYFSAQVAGAIERFALPGLDGMNFLLHEALDGGGTASLRNDALAKTYAQMLLDYPIAVPVELAQSTLTRRAIDA